jgi:hypothetical protein
MSEQEATKTTEGQITPETPPVQDDPLANIQISDEAKTQLKGNDELLKTLTHNLTAKREANAEAKKYREELEALKATAKKAENEKLKEKGEFKKLYDEAQSQLDLKNGQIKQMAIQSKLSILAAQAGIKKAEYLKLFDTQGIELDENFQVQGLDEKFVQFKQNNLELFGLDNPAPSIDSGKPQLNIPQDKTKELEELKKEAKRGGLREITRLHTFEKEHGLLKRKTTV